MDGYKGIGRRMLDGRQVAAVAHAVCGNTDSARALLADTTPEEPWENAVTACLTIQCHGGSGSADLTTLLDRYRGLDTSMPGLVVFHTLGLSYRPTRQITVDLINYATVTRDGYAARDVLAHNGCRELLTNTQHMNYPTSSKRARSAAACSRPHC